MKTLSLLLVGLALKASAQNPAPPEAKPAPKPAEAKPVIKGWPEPEVVLAAMKKASQVMRSEVAFAGGYAWHWPQDMSIAHGENSSSPTLIMIQPPGTPEMGITMLHAYQATGDKLFLQAARESAGALQWCQLASGGWGSDFDFDPRVAKKLHFRRDIEAGDTDLGKRHASSTLDDDKTQSALLFLLEMAHEPTNQDDKALRAALTFGLHGLLAAQAANGGWPQHFHGPADPNAAVIPAKLPKEWPHIWPGVDYTGFYTLNDNNLLNVMRLLLRARELEKDERYLESAKKLGRFLLLAKLPGSQPVWAQQYNAEMEPVWARKFEPPAACSIESLGALIALKELWLATGDESWLAPVKPALAWFQKVKLKDGRWARYYELGTDRPLYCKAKTYEVTFDDSDLPTHYGFKTESSFERHLEELQEDIAKGRDALLQAAQPPETPKKWGSRAKGLVAKVSEALTTQHKHGWWLKGEEIDALEFVKHFRAMTSYLEAAKNGGDDFTRRLQESKAE